MKTIIKSNGAQRTWRNVRRSKDTREQRLVRWTSLKLLADKYSLTAPRKRWHTSRYSRWSIRRPLKFPDAPFANIIGYIAVRCETSILASLSGRWVATRLERYSNLPFLLLVLTASQSLGQSMPGNGDVTRVCALLFWHFAVSVYCSVRGVDLFGETGSWDGARISFSLIPVRGLNSRHSKRPFESVDRSDVWIYECYQSEGIYFHSTLFCVFSCIIFVFHERYLSLLYRSLLLQEKITKKKKKEKKRSLSNSWISNIGRPTLRWTWHT